MNESEPTIRLPHSDQPIDNCQWYIEHYVKCDAYLEYDWLGAPDCGDHDTITCRQRKPINGIMRAHAPKEFWSCWLGQCLSEELREIQPDLDLVDATDSKKVERGFDAVFELVRQMAAISGVGDAAPTKALHLLRPRFVAISDSRVRTSLDIGETRFPRTHRGDSDAAWYADRAVAVQREIRALGQDPENVDALNKLHTYANEYATKHVSDLLERKIVTTCRPRVKLSKARVLDIVLWGHAASGDGG